MFDMREIGRKIASLRRLKNMTQLELADQLNISYQAVSNWERGDSMPDIAKLSDLSRIFEITIDELLGETKESKAVKEVMDTKKLDPKAYDEDVLESVAKMMKPDDINRSMDDVHGLSVSAIVTLAPFLDEEVVDQLVIEAFDSNQDITWAALAPFMSEEALSKLALKAIELDSKVNQSWVVSLAPFLEDEAMDLIGYKLYLSEGVHSVVSLAPFISEAVIDKIVDEELSKGNVQGIVSLLPFTGDKLGETILKRMKR